MKDTPENRVLHSILEAWGAHPRVRFSRINTGVGWFNALGPCRRSDPNARPVRFNPVGTGDLVGLIAPSGRLLMVEAKSAKGAQRKAQTIMERNITRMGGLYVLCRSVKDLDSALEKIGISRFPIPPR